MKNNFYQKEKRDNDPPKRACSLNECDKFRWWGRSYFGWLQWLFNYLHMQRGREGYSFLLSDVVKYKNKIFTFFFLWLIKQIQFIFFKTILAPLAHVIGAAQSWVQFRTAFATEYCISTGLLPYPKRRRTESTKESTAARPPSAHTARSSRQTSRDWNLQAGAADLDSWRSHGASREVGPSCRWLPANSCAEGCWWSPAIIFFSPIWTRKSRYPILNNRNNIIDPVDHRGQTHRVGSILCKRGVKLILKPN